MRKLFSTVAAFVALFLLLGPGVVQSQAPDAVARPDAAATNLVTTVCASCHTLDRVKNKVADKDAWTATVTRMQEKGADLTD